MLEEELADTPVAEVPGAPPNYARIVGDGYTYPAWNLREMVVAPRILVQHSFEQREKQDVTEISTMPDFGVTVPYTVDPWDAVVDEADQVIARSSDRPL